MLNRAGLLGIRYVLAAVATLFRFQLGFTVLPALQVLFGTTAIDLATWVLITLLASSVLWPVELEKAVLRRR